MPPASDPATSPVSPPGGDASTPTMVTAVLAPSRADVGLDAPRTLAEQAVDLLRREENVLRGVIARYVRDAATVDDIFQEVSLKVLRRLDSVRDQQALRGWLFQLARNACLDWLRREDTRRAIADETALHEHRAAGEMGRGPIDGLLSAERIAAVRRALDQLPPAQREAIRLRIDEGLDHDGIAARLGINRQAVEVRLCRGRAALKERLDEVFGGDL